MYGNDVKEQYNLMSNFYNVLYAEVGVKAYEDEFINQYKEILDELQTSSKVLDSSCGNGVKATALKRKGIDVVGTDISEEMIRLTEEYAENNNLGFPTKKLPWQQLPFHFTEEFDIVFCCGNSISHSLSRTEMLTNIKSLYKVTKKGGKIVIDTRNWDKVLNENIRFNTSNIIEYNDKRYMFTYIWNLNGFNNISNVEILFVEIIDGKETKCIPLKLDFMPFTHNDFILILKECGLKVLKDNFHIESDNYSVILEK
ncbi:class I SAM-dependent methyltransferase [Wukongibacter sp. M2B1]|uniref:class I SAM-dependent methyltransferase n=1 Tax=Wukongibacter sp. M2B1 TaxID=3088895 RepID=UPI003D79A47C